MNLLRKYWLPLLAMAVMGYTHWLAYGWGHQTMEIVHNEYVTQAKDNERKIEHRLQLAVQDTEAARQEQEGLRLAASVATATHDRLLGELQQTRRNLQGQGNYSTLAERSASAVRAAMVLSDLYERDTARLVELGAAFDQAQSRGRKCETTYNQVRTISSGAE